MNYITAVLGNVGTAIKEFITGVLGEGFNNVGSLFFTTTGETVTPTLLGALLCISAGVGVGYFVFRIIKRLASMRGA